MSGSSNPVVTDMNRLSGELESQPSGQSDNMMATQNFNSQRSNNQDHNHNGRQNRNNNNQQQLALDNVNNDGLEALQSAFKEKLG